MEQAIIEALRNMREIEKKIMNQDQTYKFAKEERDYLGSRLAYYEDLIERLRVGEGNEDDKPSK